MILLLKGMVSGYTRRDGTRVSPHFRRADAVAEKAHAGQYRKGAPDAPKVPYIEHPRAVASILTAEAGITDDTTLIAALLHDTMEDTGMSHKDIADQFGKEVADVVAELTNDPSITKENKAAWQIAHAKQMSKRACDVKTADKIANLRDIIHSTITWTPERKVQYFNDALAVVSAMQHKNKKLISAFERTYREGIKKFDVTARS